MNKQRGQRNVVVTGASRGIGLAICNKLLSAGAHVIGIARDFSKTALTHPDFTSFTADVTNFQELQNALNAIRSDGKPDALICNAGSGKFGSLEQYSVAQINEELQLNLLSHIHATRELVPHFKKLSRSDFIFIGSESAIQGGRYGSIYSAAKFGIRGFAQSLRHECSVCNCHVGIINPGMVRSQFFETLDFEPGDQPDNALLCEDVAEAVAYMLGAPDHATIDEININPLKKVVKKSVVEK